MKFTKEIGLRKDDKILDVGTGKGKAIACFANLVNEKNIIASDILPKSRTYIKNIFDLRKIHFVCCAAQNLPFPDCHFDVVHAYELLRFIPTERRRLECIAEMARVTKIGGKVVIVSSVPGRLTEAQINWLRVRQLLIELVKTGITLPPDISYSIPTREEILKHFERASLDIVHMQIIDRKVRIKNFDVETYFNSLMKTKKAEKTHLQGKIETVQRYIDKYGYSFLPVVLLIGKKHREIS